MFFSALKQQSGGRKRPQNVKVGAKSAPTIWTRQNLDESKYKSGGRKRPQNSKVGAESAPKVAKWGQKAPHFHKQRVLGRFSP